LLASLVLTFGLAILLGRAALALSGIVVLVAAVARTLPREGLSRGLAQALYEIGAPWLLAHLLFLGFSWPVVPLVSAASFVLLSAGSLALRCRGVLWLINLAQLAPLGLLLVAGQPLMSGVFGITVLAPLAWQPWFRAVDGEALKRDRYRRLAQVWWWAGMLTVAWAAGR
jgi:hypothetical protein